jgi:hypothetical protein
MELTTSEVDWLLVHITTKVDWDNPFKQEEFAKLKAFIAEATLQPLDCVTVNQNTDGGRMFNKLRIAARDERRAEVQVEIGLIQFEKYRHLDKNKARALATLDFAKAQHAGRDNYVGIGYGKAVFYGSSPEKVEHAIACHNKYRTRIRVSLSKNSY